MNNPIVPPLRTCTKCGIEKPLTLEYFHRRPQNKQGFATRCKICLQEEVRAWQSKNAEKTKEVKRKSADKLREQRKEKSRERYKTDPDYRARINAATHKWEESHTETRRASQRRRSKTEEYKERNRLEQRARRPHIISKDEKQRMWEEQEGRCAYCGISLFLDIPRDATSDHFVPITREGTSDKENVVLACRPCNSQKWNRLYHEWKAVRGW